jgi:hypothetical protein
MSNVTLVVVEVGGSKMPDVGPSESTIIGRSGGGLLLLARRRLDSIRRQGDELQTAELVCGETTEASSVTQRAAIAHDLLTVVASRPCGRLVLTAPGSASIALRDELFSLAGVLTSRLPGTTAVVSVRFGAQDDRAATRGAARVVSMPFPWRDRDGSRASALVRTSLSMGPS